MAIHLMSLRGVPDDEHDEICTLLDSHQISYYETQPGNWMISAGAIWLNDEDQMPLARDLLDQYQLERYKRVRSEYQDQRKSLVSGILSKFMENPLLFVIYLAIACFILYISVKPFIDFVE